jgi:porphobilinogen synthase
MRRLTNEVRVHPANLVYPMFVKETLTVPEPIASMPGQAQHSEDSLPAAVAEAARSGIGGIMLFGVPQLRDAVGSAGIDPDGILQRALRSARQAIDEVERETGRPGPVLMADTCLDEFTDHGHCGVLEITPDGRTIVDNDATIEIYGRMAVEQAKAGAELVGPSGMMDGQVAAIRSALDAAGFADTGILAYSAKYASAFYGPFRDAVDSALQGDRRTYQMEVANAREGLREADLDLAEGADIVMVKPAGTSLDIIRAVAETAPVPVAAYQVSGEYAMIEAAAERGWIDRRAAIVESLTAIRRAGASIILTYWAPEVARWLREDDIAAAVTPTHHWRQVPIVPSTPR